MRKLLYGIGVAIFAAFAGIVATGAPIPLFTVTSGCNEASQLMACLNNLIQQLNGSSSALISFGTGGTSSGGAINGTTPDPGPAGGVLSATLGPGTSAGNGSGQTPVVLNAQRGLVTFSTNIGGQNAVSATATAQGNSSTLMVVNSYISSTSNCQATLNGVAASGLGNSATPGVPFVAGLTPTSGTWGTTTTGALLIRLGNNSGVAVPTQTFTIGFWCQ